MLSATFKNIKRVKVTLGASSSSSSLSSSSSSQKPNLSSFCSWLLTCSESHWNYLLCKNGSENNAVHLHFSFFPVGIFPLLFDSSLTKVVSPWRGEQIKGIRYRLPVFFLNWCTCGTSGSKSDSLLSFFNAPFSAAMATAACLAKSFWRQWKKKRRGGEGVWEGALSSWPTSSVIMPWSWNEAFGSTPGFREQRCELLMLVVGPAWHPFPFPSRPCALAGSQTPLLPPLGLQRGSE